MRASLKHLFSPFCRTANAPQTILCTPRDVEKKRLHRILSELQYKYRFMHTMKASFPIFWLVSQHCYNALLCIWAIIFFSTYECQRKKEQKKCCVLRDNNCCLIWAHLSSVTGFVFTQK